MRDRPGATAEHRAIFGDPSGSAVIVRFKDIDGITDHIELSDGTVVQNEVLDGPVLANTASCFGLAKRITFHFGLTGWPACREDT